MPRLASGPAAARPEYPAVGQRVRVTGPRYGKGYLFRGTLLEWSERETPRWGEYRDPGTGRLDSVPLSPSGRLAWVRLDDDTGPPRPYWPDELELVLAES